MLLAVYDLWSSPASFDFCSFLTAAERHAERIGEDKIMYVIMPGPDNGFRHDDLPPRDPAKRKVMLENIVVPMAAMSRRSAGVTVLNERYEFGNLDGYPVFPVGWTPFNRKPYYGMQKFVAFIKGDPVLNVNPNPDYAGAITITIRGADYHPSRNSNINAWQQVAAWLRARGERVVWLEDGEPACAFERSAIYKAAKLNLGINNGPVWLLPMLHAPGILFKMCADNAPCVSPAFFEACGLPFGRQLDVPGFEIVWADDDFATIQNAILNRGLL